jgi:L-ascorbate metabolism protein UlaG (beta-lactamase superfamily)
MFNSRRPLFDATRNTKIAMQLTYLGHSCFMLEVSGKKLVFDPFIRPNELASSIKFGEIRADYILVSHGHADHTADLTDLARQTGATVVTSWEIHSWLSHKGISKTHPMNIGGKRQFDFGTVHMVFAAHSSSLPDGTYAGVAAGFVIEAEGKTLYYAGDTALHLDMKLTAEKFRLDAALLPIGDNFTMDYQDACKAADFIGCSNIIAMHFDTFGFIKINHAEVADHFRSQNKTLTIPAIGDIINI